MSQATTWRLAWRMMRRERRGGIRGFAVFIACLTLGVAAIAAVGSVSEGIKSALQNDGRLLLGGDIDLRLTHYPASPEQLLWLQQNSKTLSRLAQMRVMAKGAGTGRVLAEMKAVDGRYPLYGGFRLRDGKTLTDALAADGGRHGAAVEQQFLDKLGLKPGDSVRVGQTSFEIRAVIEREPDRSSQVFRLGPRLMVSLAGMQASGLIQPGSLVRYYYRIALAPGVGFKQWIARLNAAFPEAGWRIRSVDNAAPNIQRFTNRVALFLSLVGLTTLLVGGVGIATGVSSFLNGRLATIATFKSLGASGGLVFAAYLLQILIIAGIAVLAGLALGMLSPLAIGPLLEEKLQIAAEFGLYPAALLKAAIFGLLITLVFSLWPLAQARNVAASVLFRAVIAPLAGWPKKRYVALLALLVLALAVFTVATAELRHIALWFVGGAVVAFVIFRLAAAGVAWTLKRLPPVRRPSLRMALANLHRPGAPTPAVMLALGLGLSVLTAVVLIEGNLARQVDNAIPKAAPAYYFIDVQPGQKQSFAELARKQPGVERIAQVPMLRGRILKLGGVPAREITPPPQVAWVLRGDRGLTWSATPPAEGSTVVEGDWWPADYAGPPLVSFDKAKAEAFGLKIGDTISVNLLGRPLTARIANLRAIHWNSLSINFLMIFSPGAMQGAPLSYLATAHFSPDATERDELALARAVNDAFPNVSVIRVKEILADVSAMVADIGIAVRAIASVAVLAGILVLAGAIAAHHNRRVYDAVVLKVLGATRRRLLTIFALEFALLGAITAALAALVGTIAGWAVVVHVMRAEWSFLPSAVLWTVALSLVLTVACGFLGTWRALGHKPAFYFRNE